MLHAYLPESEFIARSCDVIANPQHHTESNVNVFFLVYETDMEYFYEQIDTWRSTTAKQPYNHHRANVCFRVVNYQCLSDIHCVYCPVCVNYCIGHVPSCTRVVVKYTGSVTSECIRVY